jgi:V-type H+-transporting ATPase subunit e
MGKKENGLWVGTLIFAILGAVVGAVLAGYVYVRTKDKSEGGRYQKANAVLAFLLSLFGALCMWAMWICVYMHQMNPLILPELEEAH